MPTIFYILFYFYMLADGLTTLAHMQVRKGARGWASTKQEQRIKCDSNYYRIKLFVVSITQNPEFQSAPFF
jgi:hypothetical protein